MPETIQVSGYDNLKKTLSNIDKSKQINLYFVGKKNEEGVSWCPYCAAAEPYVLEAVEKFAIAESIFIVVDVGDRSDWKDLKNPFRTDKEIFITVVPTIIRWKGPQRLEGVQCQKPDLLEMFFTDKSQYHQLK